MEIAQSSLTPAAKTPSKGLNIALWTAQGLLATAFIAAGVMKLGTPAAELVASNEAMAWAGRIPEGLVKFIGLSELLGGIGLVAPAATKIMPKLTVAAASALVLVMVLAAGDHLMNGEAAAIGTNFMLGALAAFVAYGRAKLAPISARKAK